MRNLLFTPLRLAVGWGISPRVLGIIGIAMLVLLRVSIGWHFHSEGSDKYRQGDWDASPFFANAKGPYAEEFRKRVWDYDGAARRNIEYTEWWLGQYRDRAADYYTFGDKEKQAADEALNKLIKVDLPAVLDEYANDLTEYDLGVQRIAKLNEQADRTGVESLAGQIETVQQENDAKLKPALAAIDELWDGFEASLNALAAPNQREHSPPIKLRKPLLESSGLTNVGPYVDTNLMSGFIPYFDLIVGWCLLLGLCTPLAALAAAGFLGSVFLSQYPPGSGPGSSYYQLIECMACLVLAGTGAGRFAGLDYFIHLFVRRSVAKHATKKK